MDDGLDYNVQTRIQFLLSFDGSGDFNMLLLPDIQKQFVQHVKKVYEQDDTLGDGYVSSDLDFHFDGRMAQLEYTFSCHDENEAEAESFSAYCVRRVREKLEAFGCKIKSVKCRAEEADMTWLDQLEDAIFGPREKSPEEKGQVSSPRKKGKKRSGQER